MRMKCERGFLYICADNKLQMTNLLKNKTWPIKVVCCHWVLVPKGSSRQSTFFGVNWKPIFSHYNPKISASTHYTLEAENIWYTNLDFLMYFLDSTTSVSHTYFCLRQRKLKSTLEVKLCKMYLTGPTSISLEWKIHMSKWVQPI